MKAIAVIRCSSKPQLDKYGPAIQMTDVMEGLKHFPGERVELYRSIQLQESASGWNRKKWEAVMDECLLEYREGKAQVVVFPRTDRETRFLAGSVTKLLEVVKSGIKVYFALEQLLLEPDNLESWEQYQRQALEAQAYIRVLRRNTMTGRRNAALAGKIPAGFGCHGYLGLTYDKALRRFLHMPGQIETAKEILNKAMNGESGNQITRSLQERGATNTYGDVIQRSSVFRVLANAKVYAGIIDWDGIDIQGKVEPIITEKEAAYIAERLKRNKELSYGFGKRKWLSGRVFCQMCGRRYKLESRGGCRCYGNSKLVPPKSRCNSPRIRWTELSGFAYAILSLVFVQPEIIAVQAQQAHDKWEREMDVLKAMNDRQQARTYEREKRRRQLSFQHESGGLSNEEYLKRLHDIQKESVDEIDLHGLLKPEPPTAEEARNALNKIEAFQPFYRHVLEVEKNPQDEFSAQLAEKVGLRLIIGPPREGSKASHSISIVLELPILKRIPISNDKLEIPVEELTSLVSASS